MATRVPDYLASAKGVDTHLQLLLGEVPDVEVFLAQKLVTNLAHGSYGSAFSRYWVIQNTPNAVTSPGTMTAWSCPTQPI